jgi:hypothetical protein
MTITRITTSKRRIRKIRRVKSKRKRRKIKIIRRRMLQLKRK